MDKHRDRLPWIIGGVSVACVAAALAVSSNRLGPGRSPTTNSTIAGPLPPTTAAGTAAVGFASTPTPVPGPALAPASAPVPAPATTSAAIVAPPLATAAPPLPAPAATAPTGSQIWECTTNGQKTFSDKPCGSKSTLRELSSINIMNPAAASPPVRSLQQPEPQPEYPPENSYPDAPQESVSSAYPVYIAVPYRQHRKPDHVHRPYHASHGALPRKT